MKGSDREAVLTMQDLRDTGLCVSGLRQWATRHGVDFRAFVKQGMSETEMRRLAGDHLVDTILLNRGRD